MQSLGMNVPPPPSMDSFAPELCFCGKRTVECHEFWFCSTECARLDSLRSLDDPECHYRNVVRKAYVRAGISHLYPRRTMSAGHLLPGSNAQHDNTSAPPRVLPLNLPHERKVTHARGHAHNLNTAGFPTLSQATGDVLAKKVGQREPPIAGRPDRPRCQDFPNAPSRTNPIQSPRDRALEQISLDAVPFPEHVPARSLRHAPPSSDGPKTSVKKSIAALLYAGRLRKDKGGENPDRVFGHAVKTVVPPLRKESRPLHHQMSPPSAFPGQRSKALRRSASCARWQKDLPSIPSNGQDTVRYVVKELREACAEGIDPRRLFDGEEFY